MAHNISTGEDNSTPTTNQEPTQFFSRQEALDRFERLDQNMTQIFTLLSSQQVASPTVAPTDQAIPTGIPVRDSTPAMGAVASCTGGSPSFLPTTSHVNLHPAHAPPFITVSQGAVAGTPPAVSLSTAVAANLAQASTAEANAAEKELSSAKKSGVVVSAALSPVPSYLVELIRDKHFINFTLLRPINLKQLPQKEIPSSQLDRLLNTKLLPIRHFQDWGEAWAVYAGVVAQLAPDRVPSLISYYLLMASAAKEVRGAGWLEYDLAFRKHAAENPETDWGQLIPTLYVTTVLTKGAIGSGATSSSDFKASHPGSSNSASLYCFAWNKGGCTRRGCRFPHVCSQCRGGHTADRCDLHKSPAPSSTGQNVSAPPEKRSRK